MISTAPIPDTFNALLLDIRNYIEQRLKINECGSIQSGPSRSTPTDLHIKRIRWKKYVSLYIKINKHVTYFLFNNGL